MKKKYLQPDTKAIKIHATAILSGSPVGLSDGSQDNDKALGRESDFDWEDE